MISIPDDIIFEGRTSCASFFFAPVSIFLTNNSNYSNYSDNFNSVVNTTKVKLTFLNSVEFQKIAPHIARKSE